MSAQWSNVRIEFVAQSVKYAKLWVVLSLSVYFALTFCSIALDGSESHADGLKAKDTMQCGKA